jgi:hypothetical protein
VDPLDPLDRQAQFRDRLDLLDQLDPLDRLDRQAQFRDRLDLLDRLVLLDRLDRLDPRDFVGLMELLAPFRDRLDPKEG